MNQGEYALYNRMEQEHWWFKGRRLILRKFIMDIADKSQKSVLEVGCGTGGNLLYLLNDFGSRMGAEYNAEAVGFAQQKCAPLGIEVVRQDANQLDALARQFDCIAFLDVLYHQAIPDVDHVLASAFRTLNPQGYILISDGAFDFLAGAHSRQVHSARRFTRGQLKRQLEAAGFHVERSSYWGVLPFVLLTIKRAVLERLFAPPAQGTSDVGPTHPIVNSVLYWELKLESWLIRFFGMPVGSSVALLARKP